MILNGWYCSCRTARKEPNRVETDNANANHTGDDDHDDYDQFL